MRAVIFRSAGEAVNSRRYLTQASFAAQPSAGYADYYDRALFNGILASQDPDSGMFSYFQATRRNAKHGDSIYFHHQNVCEPVH